MTHKLFYLLIAVLLTVACSDDKEKRYEVSVDKSELVFVNGLIKLSFNIVSDGEWNIEADGLEPYYGAPVGSTDWYTVNQIYGDTNVTVTVELKEEQSSTPKFSTLKVVGKYNQTAINLTKRVE
jgi:hypothetical protein